MEKPELSSAKRQLLERWLRGDVLDNSFQISKRADANIIPLSFTQQRQLFLELLRPGTAVNNLSVCFEINGSLDADVLERSANTIISRHEILRTRFVLEHGSPVPEILRELRIKIPVVDLNVNSHPSKNREGALRLAEELALQPFDLKEAPLIRIKLFKSDDDNHLLAIVVHHSIADGWSLGIFLKELTTLYRTISGERLDILPELPLQYSDFAEWQSNIVNTKSLQASLSYWKKQLQGDIPILELPTDRKRGPHQSFSGGTYNFNISNSVITELEKIGQKEDATLFMVMLSVYIVLLHRYGGQQDIVVGTPIAGRHAMELVDLIGPFINTLALRIDVSGNPTFSQLLQKVRTTSLEAYSHQDLPFEKVVEEIKPKRDLSHSPIFQTVFNLRNSPMPKVGIPGLTLKTIEINRRVSEFDLTLMISITDDCYHGTVEYNSDLFEASTIKRFFNSFEILLQEVVTLHDAQISDLPLTSGKEELDFQEVKMHIDFPRDKCVHQLFEDQVGKTPAAVAVIFGETNLTYLELENRVKAIANYLRSAGVEPGARIGVCMERSMEIVEVLLGIHKAGGIYVPMHPSLPPERMRFIAQDANINIIVTNLSIVIENVEILVITKDGFVDPERDLSFFKERVDTNDPAYIIYTSGSTGNPKGVMVPHSALTNLLWSMKTLPGINNNDILLSVTSVAFDIAALELFLPLITGAAVVVASKEMVLNPFMLGEAINRNRVTMMQATPATWQMLVDSGWEGQPTLKALCGGDVLTRKLADNLVDHTGELWNMYGPTETTIWSTLGRVHKKYTITVGHAINNTQTYILDGNLKQVPAGTFGELYIGGEGVAIGYLNNQELTDQKFISTSLGVTSGINRLFKTGDRARYLPDYSIEILGRVDDQVKLHGHRINLNEISSVLLEHSSISEAIAIVRPASATNKILIAYYIAGNDTFLNSSELREFVKSKLPAYMVPSAFTRLEKFPLTPNGKIDRAALPDPPDSRMDASFVAPRTETERILTKIWQDALEIESIGINDNFFDLGGASIQSIQIMTSANREGLHFSPEDIFECQTIAELAEKIDGHRMNEHLAIS